MTARNLDESRELNTTDHRSTIGSIDGGTVADLKEAGHKVLHSPHHAPILLIYHDDRVYAVDNRCPHMGFPLDRGSVEEGILTCHWHHARFCLISGGTFDPFADDLRTYPVRIANNRIWVEVVDSVDRRAYWRHRLEDGLKHGLNLVIAKAVTALIDLNVDIRDIVRIGAEYGCLHRRSWSPGLTILSAMANLAPDLPRDDRILALYQGLVHVSRNTRGHPPRFSLGPLPAATGNSTTDRHLTWFRHFVDVRDEDGAERTLLTAIAQNSPPESLVEMLLAAATDHVYLDVGHVVDFINKACELLDQIGWDAAEWVLPTLVPLLTGAQRSEELASWRRPVNLMHILEQAEQRLTSRTVRPNGAAPAWDGSVRRLADDLLADDPEHIMDIFLTAWEHGASADQLGQALALAAAQRVLYFHTQNEFSDWDAVHHTLTYANALHQLLRRAPTVTGMRGLLHGVMRLYLDRFLNVPRARMRPNMVDEARQALSNGLSYAHVFADLMDQAGNADRAGALTYAAAEQARQNGSGTTGMWPALIRAVVREDADFHTLQNVEAAWRQYTLLNDDTRTTPMVATARYIAAHAPTHRQLLQTAKVAMRLQAGDVLHEE